jgi:hypothetical protein
VVTSGRLDQQFSWASNSPLQQNLQLLMTALEARFEALEALSGSYEAAVTEFQTLGLARLNAVLTPLASEAISQLQDITSLFGATSTSTYTIPSILPAAAQFLIPVDQRDTYVPTPYISGFGVDGGGNLTQNGFIAQRVSFDRTVGILSLNVVSVSGSGTFANWQLSVSPAPSFVGYTSAQTDAAIAYAIANINFPASPNFVALLAPYALLNSPALTGSPTTTPPPSTADSSFRIPTTAFVQAVANAVATTIVNAAIAALPSSPLTEATASQVRGAVHGAHAVIETDMLSDASAPVGLTDAATIALDWNTGINFTVTLNGNRVLGNPSNGQPGTWRTVLVTQGAAGTYTLSFGTQYVFAISAPVIATGAGKNSRLAIFCRSSTVFEVYPSGIGLTG